MQACTDSLHMCVYVYVYVYVYVCVSVYHAPVPWSLLRQWKGSVEMGGNCDAVWISWSATGGTRCRFASGRSRLCTVPASKKHSFQWPDWCSHWCFSPTGQHVQATETGRLVWYKYMPRWCCVTGWHDLYQHHKPSTVDWQ